MAQVNNSTEASVVQVINPQGKSPIVLVCEHASATIPEAFDGLGLSDEARESHIAWDPGAEAVACAMSADLDAVLVTSKVSRLVYDCNRPPDAFAAMPVRSEVFDVPGNAGLSEAEKAARVATYYAPFRAAVADVLAQTTAPVLVTIHSFTPVFYGSPRTVEIGILHDSDSALADAMLARAPAHARQIVRRNEPYGPQDNVTHTLREHGVRHGHPNVMIEIRNDLITRAADQRAMAAQLGAWLRAAVADLAGQATCTG